jgi:hypothetical protein
VNPIEKIESNDCDGVKRTAVEVCHGEHVLVRRRGRNHLPTSENPFCVGAVSSQTAALPFPSPLLRHTSPLLNQYYTHLVHAAACITHPDTENDYPRPLLGLLQVQQLHHDETRVHPTLIHYPLYLPS